MTDRRERAETLASLLDGRLGPRERADALAALDASEDDVSLVADAAAILSEIEPNRVATRPTTHSWHLRASLAMAAAIVTIAVALVWGTSRPALPSSGTLAGRLNATGVSRVSLDAPWPARRGASSGGPSALAIRVGVRLVDLNLLIRSHDARSSAVARQLSNILLAIPAGGVASAAFDSLAIAPSVASLTPAADLAEAMVGREDARIGSSLRALEVAAATNDSASVREIQKSTLIRRLETASAGDSTMSNVVIDLNHALGLGSGAYAQVQALAEQLIAMLAR